LGFRKEPLFWNHACLRLPSSYAEFLTSLGARTRRNYRYYRRQFDAAGHRFVPGLSAEQAREAAHFLRKHCSISSSSRDINRKLNWVAHENRPWICGLKSREDEWLALAAGFRSDRQATLLLQLNNDLSFERDSLSLVLRSYLIESLIQARFEHLMFWGGPSGALNRYVQFVPGVTLSLDSSARGWKIVRSFARRLAPALPQYLRRDFNWIAPAPQR
jgi:hypothetical protein